MFWLRSFGSFDFTQKALKLKKKDYSFAIRLQNNFILLKPDLIHCICYPLENLYTRKNSKQGSKV